MKLGVVDYVLCRGGVERFIENVLNHLPEEMDITIFSTGEALDGYGKLLERVSRPVTLADHPVPFHMPSFVRNGEVTLFGQPVFELPEELWREQDVVWMPWVNRHAVPPACYTKTVATVCDVIAVELAELNALKVPTVSRFGALGSVAMEDLLMRRLAASPVRLVAISDWTRNYLVRNYGPLLRTPEVIHLANDHIASVETKPVEHLGLPSRYLIFPAGTHFNKNHETLLMALAAVKAAVPQAFLPLVLTGSNIQRITDRDGYRPSWLKDLIGHLGLEIGRDLFLLGNLDAGEFRSVLQGATGLVFPTLAEGFGFPPLEAAYLGVPAAVSDLEVMHETMALVEAPALYFRPQDVNDLAKAMVRLEQEEESLRKAIAPCIGRVIGGSWEEIGRRYSDLFRDQMSVASLYQSYGG